MTMTRSAYNKLIRSFSIVYFDIRGSQQLSHDIISPTNMAMWHLIRAVQLHRALHPALQPGRYSGFGKPGHLAILYRRRLYLRGRVVSTGSGHVASPNIQLPGINVRIEKLGRNLRIPKRC